MKFTKSQTTLIVGQKRSDQMKLLKILSQKNRFRRQKTLEDRNRRNNLRFDGFQEETNETREESESIVTDFVEEKLS